MLLILIVTLTLVCAIQAIIASRLLHSALWLAGTSILAAIIMYMLGAVEVGVIELSVGAGLVTVLFVFAINITGEDSLDLKSLVPHSLAMMLILIGFLAILFMIIPSFGLQVTAPLETLSFRQMVWEYRQMDLLLQLLLIFSGVLGIVGLLAEGKNVSKEGK